MIIGFWHCNQLVYQRRLENLMQTILGRVSDEAAASQQLIPAYLF